MEIIGVTESVLHHLRVNIITGDLVPRQKLNETDIAAQLNVSRAPIREALRILENESLVTSCPRKGCFVSEISRKDCAEVYMVRTMVECFAIDILKVLNIRQVPGAARALDKTDDLPLPTENDPYKKYQYLREIAEFHIQIVASSDNRRLIGIFDGLFPSLARYQSLYTYIPGLMDESHREHEEVLQDINEGYFDEAKRKLRLHIEKFVKLIQLTFNQVQN